MKGEETENPMQKYQEKKFYIHATCELLVSLLVFPVFCSREAFFDKENNQVAILKKINHAQSTYTSSAAALADKQIWWFISVHFSNVLFQKQVMVCQKTHEIEWSMLLSSYCLLESLSIPDFNHICLVVKLIHPAGQII